MNRCPFVSTPEYPAECCKPFCEGWDKHAQQCFVHSIPMEIQLLSKAIENHSRSINQAVLMKPREVGRHLGACPKCQATMEYYETHRYCPVCDYSDPYK